METALIKPDESASILAIFDDLSENTKRTYIGAWESLATFMELPAPIDAVKALIGAGQGGANFIASRFRRHMLDSGIAASTAKTRLGAIAGVIKRARRIGLINWGIDVEPINVRAMPGVQDNTVRGFAAGEFNDMAAILNKIDIATPRGARDKAIIELLYNPSLRRAELCGLDLSDIDWINDRLSITGKGRHSSEWVPMPGSARTALANWINFRGNSAGPLFTRLDRDAGSELLRISSTAVYKIVRDRAADVGVTAWPHALRHTGITDVAIVTNGNLVATSGHARHRNTNTTMIYVNNVKDQAREAGRAVDSLRTG